MAKTKKKTKVVAIGVGSASFGRGLLADAFGNSLMKELDLDLMLVDIQEAALDRMMKVAEILRKHRGSGARVEATTDREKALKGADFVVISVALRRMPLWEQDYRIPLAYGFKHALGENGGPGAVFHTLRSLELVMPICQDVAKICPKATILNFTNPESRVCMGIRQLTKAKAYGLCHGVMGARNRLAHGILKRPLEEIDAVAGGLNHFFWFLKIVERETGKDLYPLVRRRILNDPSLVPPLVRKMVEVFGCYTYPSDDHIGEYLAFAHEFTGLKWHYGQEVRRVHRHDEHVEDWLEPYLNGSKAVDDRLAGLTEELAIPIVAAQTLNRRTWLPAVNVPNDQGYVENLPLDAIVEVPATVDGAGIKPQKIGPLPEGLAAFCRTQVSIQKLIVEAFRTGKKNVLLQALLLDPVVNHVGNAEKLLEDMLKLQEEYLPTFRD